MIAVINSSSTASTILLTGLATERAEDHKSTDGHINPRVGPHRLAAHFAGLAVPAEVEKLAAIDPLDLGLRQWSSHHPINWHWSAPRGGGSAEPADR